MKPIFYDGYCDSQCTFLINPEKGFYSDQPFRCSKYNVDLDYFDWVLQLEECLEDSKEK